MSSYQDRKSHCGDKTVLHSGISYAGGGGLALFGTGNLHTWAEKLEDLIPRFTDARKIDRTLFMDDSAYRQTHWANYSTGLGAALHELGHTFDLAHTPTGVMARGFDDLYRVFTVQPLMTSRSSSRDSSYLASPIPYSPRQSPVHRNKPKCSSSPRPSSPMTRSTPPPSSLVAVAPTGATTVPAIVQIETAFKRLTTATTQTFTVNNYDGSETKCTILKNKDGTEIVTEVKTFPDGEKVAKEIIRNTSTGRQRTTMSMSTSSDMLSELAKTPLSGERSISIDQDSDTASQGGGKTPTNEEGTSSGGKIPQHPKDNIPTHSSPICTKCKPSEMCACENMNSSRDESMSSSSDAPIKLSDPPKGASKGFRTFIEEPSPSKTVATKSPSGISDSSSSSGQNQNGASISAGLKPVESPSKALISAAATNNLVASNGANHRLATNENSSSGANTHLTSPGVGSNGHRRTPSTTSSEHTRTPSTSSSEGLYLGGNSTEGATSDTGSASDTSETSSRHTMAATQPARLPRSPEDETIPLLPFREVQYRDGGAHWYRASAVILRYHKWLNPPHPKDPCKPPELHGPLVSSASGLRVLELRTLPDSVVFHHWEFLHKSPPTQFRLKYKEVKELAPNAAEITLVAEDIYGNILKKKIQLSTLKDSQEDEAGCSSDVMSS